MMTSRLSLANSSRLSFATIPEYTENEFEPLQNRWDAEKDMDKSVKIQRRTQESTVRLRKMNSVAERLLEGKIKILRTSLTKTKKELKKETNTLKEEIKDYKPIVFFPRIDLSTPSLVGSRAASRLQETPSRPGTRESACQSCIFGTQNTQCKHFPCYLPVTYNSLGFQNRPQTYSVVSNYDKLLRRCRDRRPVTSLEVREDAVNISSVEDILKTPQMARISIQEKERGLKQLVKELKQRNERTKPRDWATNYGDPVPRRMLLKPAKPIPDDI